MALCALASLAKADPDAGRRNLEQPPANAATAEVKPIAETSPARSAAETSAKARTAARNDATQQLSTTQEAEDEQSEPAADPTPPDEFIGECDGVYVYIVTLSVEHPSQSAATLSLAKKGSGNFRTVGQTIGPFEVVAITDDWSGLNPKVWLRDGREICHVSLEGNQLRQKRSKRYQREQRRKKSRKRRSKRKKRR